MLSDAQLKEQLAYVLNESDFSFLGRHYRGKVRDNYINGDVRYLITSDRLSCFDRNVTTIPFKGELLNSLAVHWFALTEGIVKNHIIDVPDPNVMVATEVSILPVEVVVRAYLAGSSWRDYSSGSAISGIKLPPGLKQNSKLPEIIITPSTKAPNGSHDLPISEEEIAKSKLVEPAIWQEVREAALALFQLGTEKAAEQGLLLVDTKYEFGLSAGKVILADEIHTLDSSRFWIAKSYEKRFKSGEQPEMLDKEPVRQWLLNQGYKGDGPIPQFSDIYRVEIAKHYMKSFELVSGTTFQGSVGDVSKRIVTKLHALKN